MVMVCRPGVRRASTVLVYPQSFQFPHASVRHHHCACALAVDEDGADGTFVLGVHRAVAVGIT